MRDFRVFFKKNSGSIARERLKGVILADRLCCSPETTDRIKKDISQVLSKYIELDHMKVKIRLDISRESGRGV